MPTFEKKLKKMPHYQSVRVSNLAQFIDNFFNIFVTQQLLEFFYEQPL